MNKVFLNKNGELFINGNEIKDVSSVSIKTDWCGTKISVDFNGDYKSEFVRDKKVHSLNECTKE